MRYMVPLAVIAIIGGCCSPDIGPRSMPLWQSSKPTLANRDAVARYLATKGTLRLSQPVGILGQKVVTLEDELVNAGARLGDDGELYAFDGKPIYFHQPARGSGTEIRQLPEEVEKEAAAQKELERKFHIIVICDPFEPLPC